MGGNDESDDIKALAELLPFYANGTLDRAARDRVDLGLQRSAWLRGEFEAEQRLASTIKTEGEKMTNPTTNQNERLEGLMERIDAETPAPAPAPQQAMQTPASPSEVRSLMSYLNPKRWNPVVSLALAAAVIGQGVYIATNSGGDEENYHVVSGPDRPLPADTPLIIVRIADTANWSEVQSLLETEKLAIVAGPTEGRLTLAMPDKSSNADAMVTKLGKSPLIAFAGKVQ